MFAMIFSWDYPPLHQSSAELVLCTLASYCIFGVCENTKMLKISLISEWMANVEQVFDKVQGYGTQIKILQDRTLTKSVETAWPI